MNPPASLDVLAPRQLLMLMAAVSTAALGYGVVMPVLPAILERISVEADRSVAWHVGLLGSVYMLALFVAAPACGRVSDRIGRRPLILWGLAAFASAFLLLSFASTLPALYAGQLLSGIAAGAVIPAGFAYVADASGLRARPRRFAAMGIAAALGSLLGPALGAALIADNLSIGGSLTGAAMPFLVVVVLVIGAWIGTYVGLSEPQQLTILAAGQVVSGDMRGVASWPTLVLLASFGLGTFEVAVTLRGQQVLLLPPSAIAGAFVVCSVVMLAAQALAFTRWFDTLIHRRAIVPAFLVMTLGLALLTRTTGGVALAANVGLVAAAYAVLTLVLTYQVSLDGSAGHGRAFGKQIAIGSLGQGLGSAGAGFLFSRLPDAPFWVGAALMLLGATVARVLSDRPSGA